MQIVFASGNIDKINQISLLLDDINLKSPKDLGIENFEVDEDGLSLSENAYKKAKFLYDQVKLPTFADDTGLFVKAINNRPGVHSHRYAGTNPSYKENRDKLLAELEDKKDRSAYFKTVICFIDSEGKDYYFDGSLHGEITKKEFGDYEFGYDQIFKPKGLEKTLGQLTNEQINQISHRSIAIDNFYKFIKENYEKNSYN